jgi:hypothetical protein
MWTVLTSSFLNVFGDGLVSLLFVLDFIHCLILKGLKYFETLEKTMTIFLTMDVPLSSMDTQVRNCLAYWIQQNKFLSSLFLPDYEERAIFDTVIVNVLSFEDF